MSGVREGGTRAARARRALDAKPEGGGMDVAAPRKRGRRERCAAPGMATLASVRPTAAAAPGQVFQG